MWVRSQDGRILVRVQYLSISHANQKQICGDIGVSENDFILGEYATEERALEILDNVQYHLKIRSEHTLGTEGDSYKGYFVFQMPKE